LQLFQCFSADLRASHISLIKILCVCLLCRLDLCQSWWSELYQLWNTA